MWLQRRPFRILPGRILSVGTDRPSLPDLIMSVNDEGSDGIQEPLLASNPQIHEYAPDTEEEKRFLRKLDLCLLPAVWFMFLLSYMDRTK